MSIRWCHSYDWFWFFSKITRTNQIERVRVAQSAHACSRSCLNEPQGVSPVCTRVCSVWALPLTHRLAHAVSRVSSSDNSYRSNGFRVASEPTCESMRLRDASSRDKQEGLSRGLRWDICSDHGSSRFWLKQQTFDLSHKQ